MNNHEKITDSAQAKQYLSPLVDGYHHIHSNIVNTIVHHRVIKILNKEYVSKRRPDPSRFYFGASKGVIILIYDEKYGDKNAPIKLRWIRDAATRDRTLHIENYDIDINPIKIFTHDEIVLLAEEQTIVIFDPASDDEMLKVVNLRHRYSDYNYRDGVLVGFRHKFLDIIPLDDNPPIPYRIYSLNIKQPLNSNIVALADFHPVCSEVLVTYRNRLFYLDDRDSILLEFKQESSGTSGHVFSKDGKHLVTTEKHVIKVWDWETKSMIYRKTVLNASIPVLSPDDQYLVVFNSFRIQFQVFQVVYDELGRIHRLELLDQEPFDDVSVDEKLGNLSVNFIVIDSNTDDDPLIYYCITHYLDNIVIWDIFTNNIIGKITDVFLYTNNSITEPFFERFYYTQIKESTKKRIMKIEAMECILSPQYLK
eukprot:TRINITY_DN10810_c0_g1_i1.p1 TRINITY_DN10810_c0_g1~~TRINITY_DN10810_c0_g1_i1.p1  ORF type:complete len:423 (-),score=73.25 TRINITY_DN10810_c0_g1_i1:119-1387(-)